MNGDGEKFWRDCEVKTQGIVLKVNDEGMKTGYVRDKLGHGGTRLKQEGSGWPLEGKEGWCGEMTSSLSTSLSLLLSLITMYYHCCHCTQNNLHFLSSHFFLSHHCVFLYFLKVLGMAFIEVQLGLITLSHIHKDHICCHAAGQVTESVKFKNIQN